jgi:ribosomal protein S18 acetylase RimI-like enzyme
MPADPQKGRKSPSVGVTDRSSASECHEKGKQPEGGSLDALRPATAPDLGAVARLHADEIGEGFLSALGPRFLSRLYQRIAADPRSFVLIEVKRERVEGFVAGSIDVRALYRSFLWRDGLVAALAAAPRLVPGWRRALETLGHGGKGPAGAQTGELLAIAVAPRSQGRGIGQRLVLAFLGELERRGISTAQVVVAADNHRAIELYRRCGFATSRTIELHAGTASLLMERRERPGSQDNEGSAG